MRGYDARMITVAGLGVFLAALYAWLAGHWFGRVIAFLSVSLFWTGLAFLFWTEKNGPHGVTFVLWVMALGATWIGSGVPQWYWRRKDAPFNPSGAGISLVKG